MSESTENPLNGQEREISLVIGTAGHIDHGKTTLISALTGVDCDRLIEEKKRLYVAYREQKQQAKELQTVRDNIRHTLSVQPKKQRDAER